MKKQSYLTAPTFAPELEDKFSGFTEKRARPVVAFIYWIGGILPLVFMLSDYFNDAYRFDELLLTRSIYMVFWATITFATLSKWRLLTLTQSMLLYVAVGMCYVPYLNMIVGERYVQVVPTALFYLFGIVISQLGAKMALKAGLISCVMPTLLLLAFDKFNQAERNIVFLMFVWGIATWVASLILEKINRRLFLYEHDLDQANRHNQELREKEAQANRFKSDFLAQMSHEIRTPLTAILGYAESYFSEGLSRETKDGTVRTIRQNGEHILTLVNDILDLSKIEAGKLQIEKLNTNWLNVIEQVQQMQAEQAYKKGLEFNLDYHYPLPTEIITDPTRLKQILINLTSNAIKFTAHGSVNLAVSYSREQNTLLFILKDSGIGMSNTMLTGLFKPYHQGDISVRRNYGGTGLGLYICKQLVEKLGGEIKVRSTEGQGSTFTFSIKAEQTASSELIYQSEGQSQKPNHEASMGLKVQLAGHVLIAEDNTDNRKLITLKLEQLGLQVTQAEHGEQAVEKALLNDFDLILMDIQMPVMSGEEAIEIIRASDGDIPCRINR
ncbi:hypothetical protein C2869_21620 [Saccharobesus litoralis]|uniref:histidine kinase n=1 Tax=Saccharobesus litoralis TaxID=2172099 RepID=A0A2S0VX93_9ALTE|nr:ATP-binding protein [Saccharobesus litoralis]AWB68839.1 hypothetical protein C2869_21620 [Saccharobesus litoralis]